MGLGSLPGPHPLDARGTSGRDNYRCPQTQPSVPGGRTPPDENHGPATPNNPHGPHTECSYPHPTDGDTEAQRREEASPGHRARRRPQRKQGGHECLSSQGASALASWAAPVYPARHVCAQFYRNTVTLVHFNTACGTVALTKAEPRGGDRDRLAGNAAARPFAVCRLAKTDPASAPEALRGLLSSLSLRAERTFG